MNAKLLEERTVLKIGELARVERIGLTPDFHMTPGLFFCGAPKCAFSYFGGAGNS
jgi:hypothetical protein